MQSSQFTIYSLGVAAENKSLSSRHLAVIPHEINPGLDGEVAFNPQEQTFKGQDREGNPYELNVVEDATLTAEWLPLGTNRLTPPDIRRGEPVLIYRAADTDRYYWRCMGLRDDLRRLETVIYAYNANPDANESGVNLDDCYFLEISTHEKLVTFGTSMQNGEPYTYAFQLNTGEGKFTMQDSLGNQLYLNTGEVFWEIINAAGTYIRLDKEHIYAYARQSIEMEAGKLIELRTTNFILKASDSARLEVGNEIYMSAQSINHQTPISTFSGEVQISGNMTSGSISTGGISCSGVNSSGNVNAPNIK